MKAAQKLLCLSPDDMGARRAQQPASGPQRGFTLVELMVVVVIVGVMAALAIVATRRYIRAARTSEAGEMINAIKAAQESYKVDAFTYLDVSGVHATTDMTTFYPTTKPGNFKTAWGESSSAVGKRWKALNLRPDGGAVFFAYGCSAGEASDTVDAADVDSIWGSTNAKKVTNWPPADFQSQWYVVKVVGDLDGSGTGTARQLWLASNFTDQVFNNSDGD